jgi:purine-nucleoside phosphorylase
VATYLESITKYRPGTLIVCGSGLGQLAEDIEEAEVIPYKDIPGFAVSTVSGHKGQLVFGLLAGKCVVAMQGRVHMYEG